MKRVVSISLWGNDRSYIDGAKKNAVLSSIYYPGWEFRIYAEKHLHPFLVGIQATVLEPIESLKNGRFWRFAPAFESDVEVMISRDADSRISEREARCVAEWLNSDKKYHVIRDHVRHYDFPMLAGLWGVKGTLPCDFDSMFQYSEDKSAYLADQIWLANSLWKRASSDVFISGIRDTSWMSAEKPGNDFVGQGYDENDCPRYPL